MPAKPPSKMSAWSSRSSALVALLGRFDARAARLRNGEVLHVVRHRILIGPLAPALRARLRAFLDARVIARSLAPDRLRCVSSAPRSTATRSLCCSGEPNTARFTAARREYRWMSCSHVTPMPPLICTQSSIDVEAAIADVGLGDAREAGGVGIRRASIARASAVGHRLRELRATWSMSAMRCFSAWNDTIGRPNANRSSRVLDRELEHAVGDADRLGALEGERDLELTLDRVGRAADLTRPRPTTGGARRRSRSIRSGG